MTATLTLNLTLALVLNLIWPAPAQVQQSETDADDELLSLAVLKGGAKVVVGSQSGMLDVWSWGHWAGFSDRFPGGRTKTGFSDSENTGLLPDAVRFMHSSVLGRLGWFSDRFPGGMFGYPAFFQHSPASGPFPVLEHRNSSQRAALRCAAHTVICHFVLKLLKQRKFCKYCV